jgi:hypothetical protein
LHLGAVLPLLVEYAEEALVAVWGVSKKTSQRQFVSISSGGGGGGRSRSC